MFIEIQILKLSTQNNQIDCSFTTKPDVLPDWASISTLRSCEKTAIINRNHQFFLQR